MRWVHGIDEAARPSWLRRYESGDAYMGTMPCACACTRACTRACMRSCVHTCVRARRYKQGFIEHLTYMRTCVHAYICVHAYQGFIEHLGACGSVEMVLVLLKESPVLNDLAKAIYAGVHMHVDMLCRHACTCYSRRAPSSTTWQRPSTQVYTCMYARAHAYGMVPMYSTAWQRPSSRRLCGDLGSEGRG